MQLSNTRARVTGGSSRIGRAIAALLIERGGKVVISGRGEAALRKSASELGAIAIRGDVSIEADARRMVATTIADLGDYNVVINNAGFER